MSWKEILKGKQMGSLPEILSGNKQSEVLMDEYQKTQTIKENAKQYLEYIQWAKDKNLWNSPLAIESEELLDKLMNLDDTKYEEAKKLYATLETQLADLKRRRNRDYPPIW